MFTREGSFWFAVLLLFSLAGNGQTLDTPNFTVLPCYGQSGLTHYVEVQPVAGADGYIWGDPGGNTFLINGQLLPVTTTVPSVLITYNSTPDSVWKLCVYAYSVCCTSATNCQIIYNSVPVTFWPTNSPTAYPNTTDFYGIYFNCLPLLSSITIYWTLTGDITFSNLQQSITSDSSSLIQTLIFGPGFTSGTLCVYTVNSSGASSTPICINIINPTSVPEHFAQGPLFYYNSSEHTISFNEEGSHDVYMIALYDISGKKVFEQTINHSSGNKFRLPPSLKQGLYSVQLLGKQQHVSGKILIH